MKIGLIDVDGHNFPNYALMKIAAYHRQNGDTVEWVNYLQPYDKVYQSKVFTFTSNVKTVVQANEIIKGGRAINSTIICFVMIASRTIHCIRNTGTPTFF
jgi:hypothetical protein